jgi:HPt (histidine-containing phosphotransfer) domain-containing protein
VETELDLTKIIELEGVLGAGVPEIIERLVREIDEALASIEAGLADRDLAAAANAAHAARNSALMLDARPVLPTLGEIESGARSGNERATREGLQCLESAWPELRRRLRDEAERRG